MLSATQGFVTPPDTTEKHRVASDQIQLLPNDITAEEALLGALLIDPPQMIEVGYLEPKDFYITNHGHLYKILAELFNKHGDYDYVTIRDGLDSAGYLDDWGGLAGIGDLMKVTPTSYGAKEYAAIVYRHSISRQLIHRCTMVVQAAYRNDADRPPDEMMSKVLKYLAEIDATRNASNGARSISKAVGKFMDHLEAVQAGEEVGLKTDIKDLDRLFGGFMKKRIYLLAGRPGMGKSGLALQFAHNLARRGKRVLYFSLEMAEEDLAARLVSQRCQIAYERFNGYLAESEWPRVINATTEVDSLPIVFDDTPALITSAIRSIAQKEMIRNPFDLLIVDHAGIIRSTVRGNRYEQQSQVADDLMALPKQLDCPVLALLQLSRSLESRRDKRPIMADLRDSGKWEEDADGIMFLYRDEVYNPGAEFTNMAEIIVAKNRGGKTGTVTVFHDKTTSRFSDLQVRSFDLEY